MGLLSLILGLAGCDSEHIKALEEGVATEADVRARFGEPEKIWEARDLVSLPVPGALLEPGARTLEYNRQPAGNVNYMITIGPDGKMSALRQVLTPETFRRVQPGMGVEDVRRLLGKPDRQVPYALKREVVWTWRFLEPPSEQKAFNVVFSPDYRVIRTEIGPDPDGPDMRGGG